MQPVPLKRFRRNLSRLVRGRESLTITDRGKPLARLVPLRPHPKDRSVLRGLIGFWRSRIRYDIDEVAYGGRRLDR